MRLKVAWASQRTDSLTRHAAGFKQLLEESVRKISADSDGSVANASIKYDNIESNFEALAVVFELKLVNRCFLFGIIGHNSQNSRPRASIEPFDACHSTTPTREPDTGEATPYRAKLLVACFRLRYDPSVVRKLPVDQFAGKSNVVDRQLNCIGAYANLEFDIFRGQQPRQLQYCFPRDDNRFASSNPVLASTRATASL